MAIVIRIGGLQRMSQMWWRVTMIVCECCGVEFDGGKDGARCRVSLIEKVGLCIETVVKILHRMSVSRG
jgi:hypothetical protein